MSAYARKCPDCDFRYNLKNAMNVPSSPEVASRDGRLDSWKEIAAYLGRNERTVRRWEQSEGLPVHRLMHDKKGSVYAYRAELDAWRISRKPPVGEEEEGLAGLPEAEPLPDRRRGRRLGIWIAVPAAVFAAGFAI